MKLPKNNTPMVQVFDSILPEELCNNLIDIFENSQENHEYLNEDNKPCFTQLNLNQHHPEVVKGLVGYTQRVYGMYSVEVKKKFLPRLRSLEEFRIKRYNPNGEERFDEHVDVATYATARRCLAFLFYLNDSNGLTDFTDHGFTIEPECGKVLVFPPTWEYPHIGHPPTNTKYILSTYIHYE